MKINDEKVRVAAAMKALNKCFFEHKYFTYWEAKQNLDKKELVSVIHYDYSMKAPKMEETKLYENHSTIIAVKIIDTLDLAKLKNSIEQIENENNVEFVFLKQNSDKLTARSSGIKNYRHYG